MSSPLVLPQHLARKAVIYIRQSTASQVLFNTESAELQRAMQHRALELGWSPDQIEVVSADTGSSASSAVMRLGFKHLLSEIAVGNVGLLLSYESTRLSRNCSDWYPLLDLCALKDCLIADRDGVYNPASINGRLLLGMKGILSEVELHTLRGRLNAGILNKARRGELRLHLPIGYVRLEDGRVVQDPDRQVRHCIQLVFQAFFEKGSVGRVLRMFRDQGLLLPRRFRHIETHWKLADVQYLVNMLRNPTYAGAYVYGRKKTLPPHRPGVRPQQRERPIAEWSVVLQNHHPGYIGWEEFLRIREMLRDNYAEYQKRGSRGAPREGSALLQGISYCGHCGRKLSICYSARVDYVCRYEAQFRGGSTCLNVSARPIDTAVAEAFFAALEPSELDVYEEVISARRRRTVELERAHQQELERLRYEADLARRRYERVDPANRLVAGELERRWEEALTALAEAERRRAGRREERTQPTQEPLPPEWRQALEALGEEMPGIWSRTEVQDRHRKSLLRTLIDKVVLIRPRHRWEEVSVRVVWRGGAVSALSVPVTVGNLRELSSYPEMVTEIRRLVAAGEKDSAIAERLTAAGFRSARNLHVSPSTVSAIRKELGLLRSRGGGAPVEVVGHLTLRQLAEQLSIPLRWFYEPNVKQRLRLHRDPQTGVLVLPDRPEVLERIERLRNPGSPRQ